MDTTIKEKPKGCDRPILMFMKITSDIYRCNGCGNDATEGTVGMIQYSCNRGKAKDVYACFNCAKLLDSCELCGHYVKHPPIVNKSSTK